MAGDDGSPGSRKAICRVGLRTPARIPDRQARRDRQEVLSRLRTLLLHLLKWEHQPDHRSNSWVKTIEVQRLELRDLLESGTLRNHAQDVLAKAYEQAVKLASIETGLSESTFPQACPLTLEDILERDYRAETV
ncbi:MAG: DUF29 domain-containing protein [Planctomycetaceae bacterium]|nr:DUF29 domain-containing protein [Planctomycetaceae bacterium]